jgi:hypothetical protein
VNQHVGGRAGFWCVCVLVASVVGFAQAPPAPAQPSPDDLLARYAIDLAAERDVAPISLDADGSGLHGVAYDRFTLAHLFARGAQAKSTPFNAAKPPKTLLSKQLIIVALPLTCGTRVVRPVDVDIDNNNHLVLKFRPFTPQDFRTWLPGATVPPGAVGVMFNAMTLYAGDVVKIHYAGPDCSGSSNIVSLPVVLSDARPLDKPVLQIPDGETATVSSVTLHLDGVVDLDGKLRYGSARDATTWIGKLALDAASGLHFEPARINRSPIPWSAGVILTFTMKK